MWGGGGVGVRLFVPLNLCSRNICMCKSICKRLLLLRKSAVTSIITIIIIVASTMNETAKLINYCPPQCISQCGCDNVLSGIDPKKKAQGQTNNRFNQTNRSLSGTEDTRQNNNSFSTSSVRGKRQ